MPRPSRAPIGSWNRPRDSFRSGRPAAHWYPAGDRRRYRARCAAAGRRPRYRNRQRARHASGRETSPEPLQWGIRHSQRRLLEKAYDHSPRRSQPSIREAVMNEASIAAREQGLRKGLTQRQVVMIGLGGAIGTGLFLGSSIAIGYAGPAVLISYAIAGFIAVVMVF